MCLTVGAKETYNYLSFPFIKEEFSLRNGQFKETAHYNLSIKLGEGAFGDCHLAVKVPDAVDETDEGRVFCVKKVTN